MSTSQKISYSSLEWLAETLPDLPSNLTRDLKLWIASHNKEFSEFEKRINSEFGLTFDRKKFSSFFVYVASLNLVDILNQAVTKSGTILPDQLEVLEVGTANWPYVHGLYSFLSNYDGKRDVRLTGIDIAGNKFKGYVQKLIRDIPASYMPADVMDLDENERYDVVFIAHPFVSPEQFQWNGLAYSSPDEIISKSFELLKPGGHFIGTARYHAAEASIFFAGFPKEKKIYDNRYYGPNTGSVANIIEGCRAFDNNRLVIGVK